MSAPMYDETARFDFPADPQDGPTIVTQDNLPAAFGGPAPTSSTGGRIIAPADLNELALKVLADLELRLEFGADAVAGESVGFREFDDYLTSEAGRMMLLGGGPGCGKTALALQMARYVATRPCVVDVKTGRTETGNVLYVLTEMTPVEMMVRMVQGFAGLTNAQLKRHLTPEIVQRAKQVLRVLRQSGVILTDATEFDIDDVIATMDHAKSVHGDRLRMVFFDNMSMVEHSKQNRRGAEQHLRVADSAQKLKRCAQKNRFPLWVLAHTKRKSNVGRYRPGLEDFADTSKLERIADSAIILTEKLDLGEGVSPYAGVSAGAGFGSALGGFGSFTGVADGFDGAAPVQMKDAEFLWRELYVVKNRGEKNGFVISLKFFAAQMRFEEPHGPTWRPYQVPDAEGARVAEYRARRRELDL